MATVPSPSVADNWLLPQERPLDSTPRASSDRSNEAPSSRRFMVLLVEDNRADVLVVRESVALHKLPVDLHVVSDGEQAFDFIKRAEIEPEAPRPHLLLVDLNLPKRSGREILQRVRESSALKDVPVMIVTSSSSARDRKELLRLGAND